MVNPKNAFWQALISAILIFGMGMLLGIYLEDSRSRNIETILLNSEINSVDQQLINQVNNNFDIDCKLAENNLVNFADKIYEEAQQLETYDSSSDLTDTLTILHRKYDLLRIILWTQSIDLKEKCGANFNTIVYIYQYLEPPIKTSSTQATFSRFLSDIKEGYGNKIILIPIAGDLDLNSLDLIKESYSINTYPAIIINEKIVIEDLDSLTKIENYLNQNLQSLMSSYPSNL